MNPTHLRRVAVCDHHIRTGFYPVSYTHLLRWQAVCFKNEGGDSEWLINYLKPIINGSCVQSMSIPLKKDKNLKEILKIKEMYSKPGIDAPG